MKAAVEHRFTGPTNTYLPLAATPSYDPTKTNLGGLIQQRTGPAGEDKFVGPMPIGQARPMEAAVAIPVFFPFAIPAGPDLHWVFLADNAAVAATRRVVLYSYQPSTSTWSWRGFVTLNFPGTGNKTVRGLRATLDRHTSGTASASGTTVTGVGTAWQTDRIASGARIGFGSTDPNQITTWYEISSIGSNTGITLTGSAGTIPNGPYVIEEIRLITTVTSSTADQGGLYVAKGLNPSTFTPAGTTIASATTTDNLQAVYWLADASTVTNTTAAGVAIEDKVNASTQNVYVINGAATTCKIFKYNVRAPLTGLSAGKTTAAYVTQTGNQTVTGNISQNNNGRVGTLTHGPGANVPSLYFVTATRVYRAALADIQLNSTTYIADSMSEIPPGSTTTYPVGAFSSIEIMQSIDRLIICATGATSSRSYVTRYSSNADPFDHIFLIDTRQLDQSSSSSELPSLPSINASAYSCWSEGGVTYLARHSSSAAGNAVYAVPLSAHWTYASSTATEPPCAITPKMETPAADRLVRLCVNDQQVIGGDSLGVPAEAIRLFVRTEGIDDDSGTWLPVNRVGDLTAITPSGEIQVRIEFRMLGFHALPARVFSVSVIYDTDDFLPAELEWNLSDSDDDGTVGFTQLEPFGATPTFTIRYFRSDTDNLVFVQDSTSTTNGVFEYWDGSAWVAGIGPDTAGTRRRFRPTSGLPAATTLYAKLSVS